MDHLKGEIHEGRVKPYVNAARDRRFLDILVSGDLTGFDSWTDKDILEQAGYGGGGVRTWIAAAAAAGNVAGTTAPFAFMGSFFRASNHPDALRDEDASGVQTFGSLEYRTGSPPTIRRTPNCAYNGTTGMGLPTSRAPPDSTTDAKRPATITAAVCCSCRARRLCARRAAAFRSAAELVPRRPFDAIGLQSLSFELVANIQALPWLSFRPFAQAFITPDAYCNNGRKSRPVNGFE